MSRCLERGLAADGRLLRVEITLKDEPGELGKLLSDIGEIGVNVRHVIQDGTWALDDVYATNVIIFLAY